MAREGFSGGKCLLYSIELLFKKNPNSNLLFQSYFPFFHLASADFTYVLFTCNATLSSSSRPNATHPSKSSQTSPLILISNGKSELCSQPLPDCVSLGLSLYVLLQHTELRVK